MNRSEVRRLTILLGVVLWELHHAGNTSVALPGSSSGADGLLYILARILAYTRSQKLESKHKPYHLYIEWGWSPSDPAQGAEKG